MLKVVAIIDQAGSRTAGEPRIPPLVARLGADPAVRAEPGFARTLGDELQGVLAQGSSVARLSAIVMNERNWWLGLGIGPIESPGETVLESSGTAFRLAREAVLQAKNRPWAAAVRGANRWAAFVDNALALYASVLLARTPEGWEAAELKRQGLLDEEIAERLSISRQAVSKRLRTASYRQDEAGAQLLDALTRLATHDVELPEELGIEP